jgi:spore photoproduct lyase
MISTIYLEDAVASHPRAQALLARFADAMVIPIDRYGSVFNRRSQSFRLQKAKPALIIAEKHRGHVLPTPPTYGIGAEANFYFSHMFNCLYDCRYCFLQGMYRSAHYLLFVNYDDFFAAIDARLEAHPEGPVHFFSGYDCDSLAMEGVTGFAAAALPFFAARPRALLELRTKSVNTRVLRDREPIPNCVVAYSLMPSALAQALDHRAPSVERRLDAMAVLAERGWQIGLRFDPLIAHPEFETLYAALFEQVFTRLPAHRVHSVSYGPIRFPKAMYRDIVRLYPEEPLFAGPLEARDKMVAYPAPQEAKMHAFCKLALEKYAPDRTFYCAP